MDAIPLRTLQVRSPESLVVVNWHPAPDPRPPAPVLQAPDPQPLLPAMLQ